MRLSASWRVRFGEFTTTVFPPQLQDDGEDSDSDIDGDMNDDFLTDWNLSKPPLILSQDLRLLYTLTFQTKALIYYVKTK